MSQQIENPTTEEFFLHNYCYCGHLINEPIELPEHEDGRCYHLTDDEFIIWACKCRKVRPIIFELEIEIFITESELISYDKNTMVL